MRILIVSSRKTLKNLPKHKNQQKQEKKTAKAEEKNAYTENLHIHYRKVHTAESSAYHLNNQFSNFYESNKCRYCQSIQLYLRIK